MIDLRQISSFFPSNLGQDNRFQRHILKEYLQLMILDYLSSTVYIRKMVFIGGTNLRLIKGIDRFSEDLDFDLKNMTEEEFVEMASDVASFLRRNGLNVELREKKNPRLSAFRCNIHFPQLLFDLKLSGHKEERFLIKIEAQDQGIAYEPVSVNVSGCGFFFPLPVPPDSVLLAMKLSALLSRAKGRDFYDTMFLWSQTEPDYRFLSQRVSIPDKEKLTEALINKLDETDLEIKQRDFEHLLFDVRSAGKILRFLDFVKTR